MGLTKRGTGFNSPISRLIAVNEESARRIFNAQPVPLTQWFVVPTFGVVPRYLTPSQQVTQFGVARNITVSQQATQFGVARNITVSKPIEVRTFSALSNSRIHPDLNQTLTSIYSSALSSFSN